MNDRDIDAKDVVWSETICDVSAVGCWLAGGVFGSVG